jgi:hypothetical protein
MHIIFKTNNNQSVEIEEETSLLRASINIKQVSLLSVVEEYVELVFVRLMKVYITLIN